MNYFNFYPGDYLRDTSRLTLIEHGAYVRLMIVYYAEEVPLPDDDTQLALIAGAVSDVDKVALRKIVDRYFPIGKDGLRHNGRIDDEIAKAIPRIIASRTNGKVPKKSHSKKPAGKPVATPAAIPLGKPAGKPQASQQVSHAGVGAGAGAGAPSQVSGILSCNREVSP